MGSLPGARPSCSVSYLQLRFSLSLQVHPCHWQSLRLLRASTHLWATVHLCPSLHHQLVDFSLASTSAVLRWCHGDTHVSSGSGTAPPDTVHASIFLLHTGPLWGMYQVEAVLCWISCLSDDWVWVAAGCQNCLSYPQWGVDCWLWPWFVEQSP